MKRKLALTMAIAMMTTLAPMSAFASSDNDVTTIAKVEDDTQLGIDTNKESIPYFTMKNDDDHWNGDQKATLRLENASWLTGEDLRKATDETGTDKEIWESVINVVYGDDDDALELEVTSASSSRVQFTLKNANGGNISKDTEIQIPMFAEVKDEGKAEVWADSSTGISEGKHTFANVSSSDVTVDIDDTTTFGTKAELDPITIEENVEGAITVEDLDYIDLELDNDFEFVSLEKMKVAGDFIGSDTEISIDYKDGDKDKVRIDFRKNGKSTLVDPKGVADFEITGVWVDADRDAKEGTVNMTVKGNEEIDSAKIEVGEYAEYKVDVKADGDAKEIFSGRYEADYKGDAKTKDDYKYKDDLKVVSDDEENELQKLIIDEQVKKAWSYDRSTVVEFPKEVKIIGVKVEGDEKDLISNQEIDKNIFEFDMDATGHDVEEKQDKKNLELTFYVSVEPGFEGDIEATVGGKALDKESKVVLGKAVAPVSVKAEVAPIKAGVRDQEIGKITIAESKAGAMKEDEEIVIELPDRDMEWDGEPDVKVTKGDLELDEIDVDDNILTITIDGESDEASTIEITNGRVRLDRSIAEGGIKAEVKGSAIMENGFQKDYKNGDISTLANYFREDDAAKDDSKNVNKSDALDEYGFFTKDYVAEVEVANVITPADKNTTVSEPVQFAIGSTTYKVGEVEKTADVAPYISNGRTMLSVRYVAEALGVPSENIVWDQATQSVTIFKGQRVVQTTVGSNKLMVGGVPVMMDATTENKEGRVCLPFSFIAKALGAEVAWDASTRTVTLK